MLQSTSYLGLFPVDYIASVGTCLYQLNWASSVQH